MVIETSLYYDARSEKRQKITLHVCCAEEITSTEGRITKDTIQNALAVYDGYKQYQKFNYQKVNYSQCTHRRQ